MERKVISTDAAPAAIGPYSQAVTAGGLVFCSGQIALDPATGDFVGEGDVRAQTRQVMQNLSAVLTASGSALSRALKITIYVTDMGRFADVNEVYGSFFDGAPPARATVEVAALPRGALVEIDAVALSS